MKIITNIPALIRLTRDVQFFNKNKAKIEAARAAGDFEEERKWILDSTSTFGSMIMKQFGCDLRVHGEENIPDSGPVVIMANHQGFADIPVLMAVFRKFQFGFIAKEYLAKLPMYGPWIPKIRGVYIENDNPRSALKAINTGIEYINDGFSMAICPEGTRSKGGPVGPFMKGAMKLATKPGVPIIPVSINGTYHMLEETGKVRGARVDVIVHPPVETAGLSRQEEKDLSDVVENTIRKGVESLAKADQP